MLLLVHQFALTRVSAEGLKLESLSVVVYICVHNLRDMRITVVVLQLKNEKGFLFFQCSHMFCLKGPLTRLS